MFLLALFSGMGAGAPGQTLPDGAVLLASESPAGNMVLFPTQLLPPQTPLPDAPVAIRPADEISDAAESSSSNSIANEWPTPRGAGQTWQPLTGRQRLTHFWNDSYDSPGAFLALSVSALAGQLENKPAQWSEDGSGYTRHFASAYGQLVAGNVIHEGLAAASGLEPRYIPCQCKGVFRRSRHALKMSFVTYTHGGRLTPDVPQLAGAYGAGMISTYWYPHRLYNPLVQGVQFGHEQMAQVFAENLFQEFTSDLKSALHLH
jgi:hypothetical protein